MDAEHQRLALSAVQERLRQRFPDVDDAVVEAAVRLSHAELTGPDDELALTHLERAAYDRLCYTLPDPQLHPTPSTTSPANPAPEPRT